MFYQYNMPNKIYPFQSEEFGTIYIETEEKKVESVKTADDDDGTVRVSSREENLAEASAHKFEKAVGVVGYVAQTFLKGMEKLQADEMELEMGMSFNGEFGLPFITKVSTEATFKVTVKWKKNQAEKPV